MRMHVRWQLGENMAIQLGSEEDASSAAAILLAVGILNSQVGRDLIVKKSDWGQIRAAMRPWTETWIEEPLGDGEGGVL